MSILPVSGVVSFARGIPAPEMFPADELAEASRRAFAKHSATALYYGAPGCERARATFLPGPGFFPAGGGGNDARLSFSFPGVDDIRVGADRLAAAVLRRLAAGGAR
jgi:DNA-binding transcriptional MocR family regulator